MTAIAILGAGMAGSGAVHRLHAEQAPSILYDQHPYYGGHTASHRAAGGFVFDEGPHVSFTKSERLQALFAGNVGHDYQVLTTRVNNYWKGYWIKHPAQCNLHGLPTDLVIDVLRDFIEAQHQEYGPIKTYADWLIAAYGATFATTFPMEYGRKYHTTTADNMTTDWLGPRLYRPKLEEVLRGALAPGTPDVHYISHFRYPSHNGFAAYLAPFVARTDFHPNHRLLGVDARRRELRFANGVVASYDHLISSLPLPELIPMIADTPRDVREAAATLACTTAVIVNLGIARADLIDAHWTYFYDRDVFFTRLSTPHLQSPHNVPPGAGSLQAEVYFSKKYRPLDRRPEDCIEPVVQDLRRVGLLREDDRIVHRDAMLIPYANVIFDLDRPAALATVRGYLDDLGLVVCGRYGEWGYHWTDESFVSGENAAQTVLDRMSSDGRATGTRDHGGRRS